MSTNKDENKDVVTKKKFPVPVILGSIAALVVIILAIIITILVLGSSDRKYAKQLALGDKYFSEPDYDNAILAYKEAIQINPRKGDAYLGLANVYIELNNMQEAERVLTEGYAASEDERLMTLLQRLKDQEKKDAKADEPEDKSEKTDDWEKWNQFTDLYDKINLIDIGLEKTYIYYLSDEERADKYDDVIKELESYIELYNEEHPDHKDINSIKAALCKGGIALSPIDEGHGRYPTVELAYHALYVSYIKAGDMEKAKDVYKEMLARFGEEEMLQEGYQIEYTEEGYNVKAELDDYGRLTMYYNNYQGILINRAYEYDGNRLVKEILPFEQVTRTYTYDEYGRVSKETEESVLTSFESTKTYDYSVPGEVRIINNTGFEVVYLIGEYGQLTEK